MKALTIKDLSVSRELSHQEASAISGGNKVPGPAGQVLDAFELGWKVGTLLDQATGLSDKIAGVDDDHPIVTPDVRNAGKPKPNQPQ